MTQVRTRFAPSPTGSLHLGGARTALYNYLLAKAHGGEFILRIEDTDNERSTKEAQEALLRDLSWLGLNWDEGCNPGTGQDQGPHAPYSQSARTSIYQTYAKRLLTEGKAYYCFAHDATIEEARSKAPHPAAFQFQSPYKDLPLAEAEKKRQAGEPAVIRFRNTHHGTTFTHQDLVRGPIHLPGDMVGDFVLLRQDGSPVYNFCCAIDDAVMGITHVLRGEEHLSNTLRQSMIYQALGLKAPTFGHLSLILGSDGKKLSKRTGAQSVDEFKTQGFLPEALLNYLALLGWSDPEHREILSMQELIKAFQVDRLNPAAPMFDVQKCLWVNTQHLKLCSDEALWAAIEPFLEEAGLQLPQDPAWRKQSLDTLRSDWTCMQDAVQSYQRFTTTPPELDEQAKTLLGNTETQTVISAWILALESLESALDAPLLSTSYQNIIKTISASCAVKGKGLFMPIRIAMIGQAQGTDLASCVALLSRRMLIARAQHYLKHAQPTTGG